MKRIIARFKLFVPGIPQHLHYFIQLIIRKLLITLKFVRISSKFSQRFKTILALAI